MIIQEDDGICVPAGEKPLIFKRGHEKSTGLGLFFIMENLSITGISIRETGVPGEGTQFEILVLAGKHQIHREHEK